MKTFELNRFVYALVATVILAVFTLILIGIIKLFGATFGAIIFMVIFLLNAKTHFFNITSRSEDEED
jgi:hypothetical protein